MTLKKAKEVMVSINTGKVTYLNTLEYEVQQVKEADLYATPIRTEPKKTKDETKTIEVILGTLAIYEVTV